jgi:hypothetical protein
MFHLPDGYEVCHDHLNEEIYILFEKEIVDHFKIGEKKQTEVRQTIRRHQEKSRGK